VAGWLGDGFLPYPEIHESENGNQRGIQLHTFLVADQSVAIWSLARTSAGAVLEPDKTIETLFLPICGEGVAATFARGNAALIEAGRGVLDEELYFVDRASDLGGFMRHYNSAEPVPAWIVKAKELYGKAVGEFYRANTRARDGARPLILRYAKRATFGLHYMTAVEAARNAGIAKAAGDEDARIENLELAIEAMHNALAIWAEVATEAGDAGAIALLNAEAYTPLLEALEEGE
jgi:hypothetical protein